MADTKPFANIAAYMRGDRDAIQVPNFIEMDDDNQEEVDRAIAEHERMLAEEADD